MNKVDSIEAYILKHEKWSLHLKKVRAIIKKTSLEETVKWGIPTYTVDSKNVVGLAAFKNHLSLWFFQGVFLLDPYNILINAQEGKTKGLRQWRIQSEEDIKDERILEYLKEAIANQKAGKEIKPKRATTFEIPPILLKHLQADKSLSGSFQKLTLGKRKEYAEYIASAKRDDTKLNRIAKILPMIRDGIGLNDKYKN